MIRVTDEQYVSPDLFPHDMLNIFNSFSQENRISPNTFFIRVKILKYHEY